MFFSVFKEKVKNSVVINDIYSDDDFSKIFSFDFHDDIEIYNFKKLIKKTDNILEVGVGRARVFSEFHNDNYNIYGIEPDFNMFTNLNKQFPDRIFNLTLQNIEKLPQKILSSINTVIIPATTISLFSLDELKCFLGKLPSGIRVIFNFIEFNYLQINNGKLVKENLNGETVIYANYIYEEFFILNAYIIKKNKVGNSVKYTYNNQLIKSLGYEFKEEPSLQKYINYISLNT